MAALLLFSFLLRLGVGFYSGGAESDAADYTTLAIQMVTDHDYSYLVQPSSGRQVFWLWLAVLVGFMNIFGATNLAAITATAFFGTLSIYLFYRLLILFWDGKTSRLIVLILVMNPVHINISHNAFYDSILLCVLFFSAERLLRYFQERRISLLLLSGISASLLAFVHATGYIYIFLLWTGFLVFSKKINARETILFSLAIGILPVLQMLLWKHYAGSFFPYQQLQRNFLFLEELQTSGYQFKHYLRYFMYLIINYSPLLFLGMIVFILDLRWKEDRARIIPIASALCLLFGLQLAGRSRDIVSPLLFVCGIVFVIVLKLHLLENNRLVFLFGMLGLSIFTLYLRVFPSTGFGPRQFVYPVAFCIPLFWHYGVKWIDKKALVAGSILAGYVLLFIPAFFFSLPRYKEYSPPGLSVPFAQFLSPALPYYRRAEKYKLALKWLKAYGLTKNDFVFSNISNRWLNANLNLPQNHYLKSSEVYDQKEGFRRQSLDDVDALIRTHQPRLVIWDLEQHRREQNIILTDGLKKVGYSPEQLFQRLDERYRKITVIEGEIVVFEEI